MNVVAYHDRTSADHQAQFGASTRLTNIRIGRKNLQGRSTAPMSQPFLVSLLPLRGRVCER